MNLICPGTAWGNERLDCAGLGSYAVARVLHGSALHLYECRHEYSSRIPVPLGSIRNPDTGVWCGWPLVIGEFTLSSR